MSNGIEKAPKRISAFKELRIFITGYMYILMGRKKNLVISMMFPVLAAIIVVWIAEKICLYITMEQNQEAL